MDDIVLSPVKAAAVHDFSGPNRELVSVDEATEIVLATARTPTSEDVALTDALGRVLKENLKADDDFPRYDNITIDGIALIGANANLKGRYRINAMQRAGTEKIQLDNDQACIEVMAGAVLPGGTDCVLSYEQIDIEDTADGRYAIIKTLPEPMDLYIHRRGSDRKKGDLLISSGTEITAAEIAVAASSGRNEVRVAQLPRIAVITTGDELVPITAKPLPYQIRESNSYALSIILKKVGVESDRFHLPDDPDVIASSIAEWTMTYDVLLFSGGVSKGVGDYIPSVLKDFGVQAYFHGVSQRPGKPFWFGVKSDGARGELIVFALPGNPVSSFVCAYRYCLPWLEKSSGRASRQPVYATLSQKILERPGLTHFIPVKLIEKTDGSLTAEPQPFHGPSDLSGLLSADAFIELPPDKAEFAAGETYPVIRYR